jgi:hypothetical protein
MSRIIQVLVAAALVWRAGAVEAQCVLAAPQAIGSSADLAVPRLQLAIDDITAAPAYGTHVPHTLDTGSCVVTLSPPLGVVQLRLRIKPTISGVGTIRLRFAAADPNSAQVSSDPIELKNGEAKDVDVIIRPATLAEQSVGVVAIVGAGGGAEATVSLPMTWHLAPALDPDIHTRRMNCGARICLFTGNEETIYVDGIDGTEKDITQVRVKANDGQEVSLPLLSGAGGRYFRWTGVLSTSSIVVIIPLDRRRVLGADNSRLLSYVKTVAAVSERSSYTYAVFQPRDDKGDLTVLRGGAAGMWVRMHLRNATDAGRVTGDDAAFAKFKVGSKFQIREAFRAANAATVAEFTVYEIEPGGTSVYGLLMPLMATATRPVTDPAPNLSVEGNDLTPILTSFVVLPQTRIERYSLHRPPRQDEPNAPVTPLEQVIMHLEGPGVGYLAEGTFAAAQVRRVAQIASRDVLDIGFTVPRNVSPIEYLTMRDSTGVATTIAVSVAPAQRSRELAAFVKLVYQRDRRPVSVDVRGDDTMISSTLRGVLLGFDRQRIDSTDVAYGVQYLELEVDLYDASGTKQRSVSKCLAVVPPSLTNALYHVEGECIPVLDGTYGISELLEPTQRATVASSLQIRIRPKADKYPYEDARGFKQLVVKRGGIMIVEPKYQLPGPVFAFRSHTLTPALTYSGAVMSLVPAWGFWENTLGRSVSFDAGIVVGSVPSSSPTADNAISGRLSGTGGVTWVVKNMLGDVTLDFFGGYVFPVSGDGFRRRDIFFAFRPGFSIPIGGGTTSPVTH